MTEKIIELLSGIPMELATVLLAMLPVGELRGSLPVALTIYDMSIVEAVGYSILGNILPVYFILIFLEKGSVWLSSRSDLAQRFFQWLFDRTRMKLEEKVDKYGVWALALFVAIPLPVTGAWTGTVAAFIFGLPKKQAWLAILLGLCMSATIVTLITLGAVATITAWFA